LEGGLKITREGSKRRKSGQSPLVSEKEKAAQKEGGGRVKKELGPALDAFYYILRGVACENSAKYAFRKTRREERKD